MENTLPLFLSLILLVFPLLSTSQTECTISLNSVLHAGGGDPPWLSNSQEFAFGFRLLRSDEHDDGEDLFLLSIWFNKIPGKAKTIVWSKNEHPVPEGSTIEVSGEGLSLRSKGKEIWSVDQTSICGAMLDSGNFVLINEDSAHVWESFSNPTDTILPGQRIGVGGSLASRRSDTNYADGRFQLRMQEDGDLVLYTLLLPTKFVIGPYWASGSGSGSGNGNNSSNGSVSELVFDENGYICIHTKGEREKESIHNITRWDLGSKQNFYYMARLDFDGVFRLYNHPRRNYGVDATSCTSLWDVVHTAPDDVCSAISRGYIGSGACGYNSFCVNSNGKPSCFCPEGYSLLDPLDTYRGCKPDFPSPSCHPNGWETSYDLVDFKELNNTDFVHTDYEHHLGLQVDKDTCKDLCHRDCFCAAAVYYGHNCWMKRFPQIIHCDIKPQNILLDEHLTPKISDFGLAKLLLSEQSRASLTHIRGTVGYFAPEWFRKASITAKADVYSFGVMLLEIVCCVSCVKFGLGDEEEALVDWAYECYREGEVKKMVDNDEEARNDMKGVERVVMVGIWCIQEDPSLRPSMRRVTQMLEGVTEVFVPPRPTFFSSFMSVHLQDLDDIKMSIKLKSFDM